MSKLIQQFIDSIQDAIKAGDPDVSDVHVPGFEKKDVKLTDYSAAQRKEMAANGEALPDGSFPIKTTGDLSNAIHDFGRAGAKPSDKAHIIKRARALGATDMLPENWNEPEEETIEMTEPLTWGVALGEGRAIQVMKTGSFDHPKSGHFEITAADLQMFKDNFDNNIRGQQLPIDVDHSGGAVGWYRALSVEGSGPDSRLMAIPDWNADGEKAVGGGVYKYFSPEFLRQWRDEQGVTHKNVLIGGAITNYPFLKNMEPIALSEFKERFGEGEKKGGSRLTDEEIAALEKKAADAEAKTEELRVKFEEAEAERIKLAEAATAASDAEVQLKEMREQSIKLAEQVKELKHNELVGRMRGIVRGVDDPSKRFSGDEEQKTELLIRLSEAHGEDSEIVKGWIANEQSNAMALRESKVFTEVGTAREGASNGTAQAEWNKEIEAIKASEKLDTGAASLKLAERRPDLYTRYDAEQKKYARTHGDS
jgi:hypothetical protein